MLEKTRQLMTSKKGQIGGTSLGGIILLFVVMVVGLAFTPTISSSANDAAVNATGLAASLLPLTVGLYVIVLIAVPAAVIIALFRRVG